MEKPEVKIHIFTNERKEVWIKMELDKPIILNTPCAFFNLGTIEPDLPIDVTIPRTPEQTNLTNGLIPNRDRDMIPLEGEGHPPTVDAYEGLDPEFAEWLAACPSVSLLDKFLETGMDSGTYRWGKVREPADEFGRRLYNRVRMRFEISPGLRGLDLRTAEEIGKCECEKPEDSNVWQPDNPDYHFCNHCKKIFDYVLWSNHSG